MKKRFLTTIYQQEQTIFTTAELSLLFPALSSASLSSRLRYFADTQGLLKLRRGVYAKLKYAEWELANKLYSPSYISFSTILFKYGVVFQLDSRVYLASYLTRDIEVKSHTFIYRKLKESILHNTAGVEERNNIWIATPERAFLDSLYLFGDIFFDNLLPLDWDKVFKLQDIYQCQVIKKRVASQHRIFKEDYHD